MIFDSSQVTCFGKSIVWKDFLVKLHITGSTFLISGQYLHLPKRVHIGVCVFLISCASVANYVPILVYDTFNIWVYGVDIGNHYNSVERLFGEVTYYWIHFFD